MWQAFKLLLFFAVWGCLTWVIWVAAPWLALLVLLIGIGWWVDKKEKEDKP